MIYKFGNWTVDALTREVSKAGIRQDVPPKAYDLLVFLLQERRRGVPKQEIFEKLWPVSGGTESALSQAVMQLRRLLGDGTREPRFIKTIHSFGYRFVGDVVESAPAPREAPGPRYSAANQDKRRIAVLPCENRSDTSLLDWCRLGIPSLVIHALEKDGRFSAPAPDTITQVYSREQLDAEGGIDVSPAFDMLGVSFALSSSLVQQGNLFWLDYELHSPTASVHVGTLRGTEPVLLAERLARICIEVLADAAAAADLSLSKDGFVRLAYARAVELANAEAFPPALKIIDAALALEPDNLSLQHTRCRCLAWLKDPGAVASARALLAGTPEDASPQFRARSLDLLALGLYMSGRPDAEREADEVRSRALELALAAGSEDWALMLRINAANLRMERFDFAQAASLYNAVEADCRRSGNLLRLALTQQNRALIDLRQAETVRAHERLEESVRIWRRLPPRQARMHAIALLSRVKVMMGLSKEAVELAAEVIDHADPSSVDAHGGIVLSHAALTFFWCGQRGQLARVRDVFHRASTQGLLGRANACHKGVEALWALGTSEDEAAASLFGQACVEGRLWPGGNFCMDYAGLWLVAARRSHDAQQLARAAAYCDELQRCANDPELKLIQGYVSNVMARPTGPARVRLMALKRLVSRQRFLQWECMLRLEAAWTALRSDDADEARAQLADTAAWHSSHPLGRFVAWAIEAVMAGTRDPDATVAPVFEQWDQPVPPWATELLAGQGRRRSVAGLKEGIRSQADLLVSFYL